MDAIYHPYFPLPANRIFGFNPVNRSVTTQPAGIEEKFIHGKRGGTKKIVVFKKPAHSGGRSIFQPGDGDMGGKFSGLRLQAKTDKTGLDALPQVQQTAAWP